MKKLNRFFSCFDKEKLENLKVHSHFVIILWISLHKLSHFWINSDHLLSSEYFLSQFSALLCSCVLMYWRGTYYQKILRFSFLQNWFFPQMEILLRSLKTAALHKLNWCLLELSTKGEIQRERAVPGRF